MHGGEDQLSAFLLNLIIILLVAKLFGQLLQRVGLPFVLGELIGGAIFGAYGLGLINIGEHDPIHLLAQIGVIILLFEIGLETDVADLIRLGPRSAAVAVIGIIAPMIGGYLFSKSLGVSDMGALLIGGAFSATSIGISIRALAELGESKSTEGQIVLGAALIDDVVGLIILSVITALTAPNAGEGGNDILVVTLLTLTLPVIAIILGHFFAKQLLGIVNQMKVRGALVIIALIMGFICAYVAILIGTSPIIGAFTAGLILARTHQADMIETQLKPIADFFTPIFFVTIGASLNIQLLNPLNPENHTILLIALGASVIAFITKFVSGFAAFGEGMRRTVIGISMAPRGEVVLIFAQLGLSSGLISGDWFAVLILMIFFTAVVSPALLKLVLRNNKLVQVDSYAQLPLEGFESEERL